MIPTIEQLQTEIAQDPKSLGYADKTVQEIFNLLMTPNQIVREGRDTGEIMLALSLNGVWRKLIAAESNPSLPKQVCDAVKQFKDLIMKLTYLRFKGNQDMLDVLGALQLLGVITAQEGIDFLALGNVNVTRVQECWGKDASVGIGYLSNAVYHDKFVILEDQLMQKRQELQELEDKYNQLSQGIDIEV